MSLQCAWLSRRNERLNYRDPICSRQFSRVVNRYSHENVRRAASFFFGVRIWLVKVLGQFSINYCRGLGLRIRVRVWVRVMV